MDSDAQFTGKYESGGRIGTRLVDAFYSAVRDLLLPNVRDGDSVLEVGCGAGYSTRRIHGWLPSEVAFSGSDIGATLVEKAQRRNPTVPIVRQSVYDLALPSAAIDVLVMLEVLEHLDRPDRALEELARVARRHVIVSTPREPIWRLLNMARGKYLRDLGNTPGHVQHWSSAGLRRLVDPWFHVAATRQPLPWTILLLTPKR